MTVPRDLSHTRARHAERLLAATRIPAPDESPELAKAWHSLQLHWLATDQIYRERVRQRVSEAARLAERKLNRNLRDVDHLGREVEGCG